jgi:CRISPR-associated endoribonuclease Cas6
MLRVRYRPAEGAGVVFKSVDLIHDAAINLLKGAGFDADKLVGERAAVWSAAASFARRLHRGSEECVTREIVISTCDISVAQALLLARMSDFRSTRIATGEKLDISNWVPELDQCPVTAGTRSIRVLCASPMVFRNRAAKRGRWTVDIRDIDLDSAINTRLSRLAGRPVELHADPDREYLNRHDNQTVTTRVKAENGPAVIVGLNVPLELHGAPEDLEFAWYAGIGEKTRLGYGLIAAA